jgi:hypothetical protein
MMIELVTGDITADVVRIVLFDEPIRAIAELVRQSRT